MSRNPDEIDPKNPDIVRIGSMVFDLAARELRDRQGNPVELRSQSAEVLAHLARHPGKVVAKEDLIAAVWPDTFVTDDSLVQCIGDIRRALGDEGRSMILTHPRKGYRLLPTPEAAGAVARPIGRPHRDHRGHAGRGSRSGRCLHLAGPADRHRRRRPARHCRAAVRGPQRGHGPGLSERCHRRGSDRRTRPQQDLCRDRPQFELQIPRPGHRCPRDRQGPRGGLRAGGQPAESRRPAAGQRAADRRPHRPPPLGQSL
jgi:DNA-binding winged helix-turn-helix (wHTH) protein